MSKRKSNFSEREIEMLVDCWNTQACSAREVFRSWKRLCHMSRGLEIYPSGAAGLNRHYSHYWWIKEKNGTTSSWMRRRRSPNIVPKQRKPEAGRPHHLQAKLALTLAPLGGPKGPPCGFSQIAPEVLGISLWNLPYLSGQQFHTLCQKIRPQVIIGQPWVTSEWRHVSPILISKMGLRESPPLVQF